MIIIKSRPLGIATPSIRSPPPYTLGHISLNINIPPNVNRCIRYSSVLEKRKETSSRLEIKLHIRLCLVIIEIIVGVLGECCDSFR